MNNMNASSQKPSITSRIAAGLAYIMPVCLSFYQYIYEFFDYTRFASNLSLAFLICWIVISIIIALFFLTKLKNEDRRFWIYHLIRSFILWPLSFIFSSPFYFALVLLVFAIFGCMIALRGERKTIFSYILPPKESKTFIENNSMDQPVQNASARDKLLAQMKHKQ